MTGHTPRIGHSPLVVLPLPVEREPRVPGWVAAVAWIAGAKITLAAGGTLSGTYDYPIPSVVFFLVAAGFGGVGAYLIVLGGRDARSLALGMFLLLVGSAFSKRLLAAFAASFDPILLTVQQLPAEAFITYFLWRFAADFPRRPAFQPRLVRVMSHASLALGVALALAAVVNALLAGGRARWIGVEAPLFWLLLFAMMLPAFPYVLWRSQLVSADERRRVRIVTVGLSLGFGPTLAAVLLSALPPVGAVLARPDGLRLVGVVVYPALLSIPLTLCYAVIVHRALTVRAVVRRVVHYATARYSFGALCAAPFAAVLASVVLRREEPMAALLSGSSGIALSATLAVGGLLLLARRPVVDALDRRFFREEYDARQIIGELVGRIRLARTRAELAQALREQLDAALHLAAVRLLVLHSSSGSLVATDSSVRPLPFSGRLARTIERQGAPVAVDWEAQPEWLAQLPPSEQDWLLDSDTRLLVPFCTADGSLLGVLCLGQKRSELPFTSEDALLLSAVASAAAAWLEHHLATRPSGVLPIDGSKGPGADLARECTACDAVAAAGIAVCGDCGSATRPAALPLIVHGKYQLEAQLGAGSMGVVYRAVDLALERCVALKALPKIEPAAVLRLRDEARAMAVATHPNLAVIFAVESWSGRPLLVVEHLPGGTLAERLSAGPLPCDETVEIAFALADALARLHGAGVLHGDIKPSNIGFTADGRPKLLDFGLARMLGGAEGGDAARVADARTVPGTPLYLSPEAARGEPLGVASDLWAFAVVVYEMVAGRHPFAGEKPHQALLHVLEGWIPDIRTRAPSVPEPLAGFLCSALSRDSRRRPGSAAELCRLLSTCRLAW